jgi:hypothetical protein
MASTDYKEQGTQIAGYEEKGPYHCGDCVHRLTKESDLCLHPAVVADPQLKSKLTRAGNQMAVRVNLEKGCCKFVKQK